MYVYIIIDYCLKKQRTKTNTTKVKQTEQYGQSNQCQLMEKEFDQYYDEILLDIKQKMDENVNCYCLYID